VKALIIVLLALAISACTQKLPGDGGKSKLPSAAPQHFAETQVVLAGAD